MLDFVAKSSLLVVHQRFCLRGVQVHILASAIVQHLGQAPLVQDEAQRRKNCSSPFAVHPWALEHQGDGLHHHVVWDALLAAPKCRLTYHNLSRRKATFKSSEPAADPTLLCLLWSPRPTDRPLTTFIPPGSSDPKLKGFPSTYFVYCNMYLEITVTF